MRRFLLSVALLCPLVALFCPMMAVLGGSLSRIQVLAQQPAVLDINTATAEQLKALPGMGPAYARRIIAARPYTAKNQLMTRGVLPASAYEQIKDRIAAHRQKPRPPR